MNGLLLFFKYIPLKRIFQLQKIKCLKKVQTYV